MGRAPCCDKANVKKGPWSPEEDAKLKSYIHQHGTGGNWIALPLKIGLKRCGKSCRLRWLNYLRPNIRHGGFSEEEDNIICSLYISIGSRWSIIAAQLPGRTDNDIKNYWNTRLKKKLLGKQRKQKQARGKQKTIATTIYNSDHNTLIFQNPNMVYQPHQLPPVPYSDNEPPRFTDHNSIRKLLIKLGGRFSNGNTQINYQHKHGDLYPTAHDIEAVYNHSTALIINPISDASCVENHEVQFDVNSSSTMLQGPISSMNLEDEFELFYDDILNGTRMDWGEMNSSGNFHAEASNSNDGFLQGIDKMRYP